MAMDVYSKGRPGGVVSFYRVTHFANTVTHAAEFSDSQRLPAPNRTVARQMLSKRHR